jgi:hypothetical protein
LRTLTGAGPEIFFVIKKKTTEDTEEEGKTTKGTKNTKEEGKTAVEEF